MKTTYSTTKVNKVYCPSWEDLKAVCYRLRSKGINDFNVKKTMCKSEYTVIFKA